MLHCFTRLKWIIATDWFTGTTSDKPLTFPSRISRIMNLLKNTPQVDAAGSLGEMDPMAGHSSVTSWFDSISKTKEMTMIVFYRGFFCTGCKVWLQEFSRLADIIRSGGGEIYGITSESAQAAQQTRKKWNLSFNLISDPSVQLAERFNVHTEDASKGWSMLGDYGTLFSQPAVVCVNKEGDIVYFWRQMPNFANIMGGTGRPVPIEIVTHLLDTVFPEQAHSGREDDFDSSSWASNSPKNRSQIPHSQSTTSLLSLSDSESDHSMTSRLSDRSQTEIVLGLQCLDRVGIHRVLDAVLDKDETAAILYDEFKLQRKKVKAAQKRLKQASKK